MRRLLRTFVVSLTALLLFMAQPGGAVPGSVSPPIVTGLVGPLGLAVTDFSLYVGEAFPSVLTKVKTDGSTSVVETAFGGEIAGVDADGNHVVFTESFFDPVTGATLSSELELLRPDGSREMLGDLWAFEQSHNPDSFRTYGFDPPLDPACNALMEPLIGPTTYTGADVVESHAYSVARFPGPWEGKPRNLRGYVVGDAAANAILGVRNGNVRTIAVLPAQPAVITAEAAAVLGAPPCVIGKTFLFESVPTDVEIYEDKILVSTLPGGPEIPELGARGSVYELDLGAQKMTRIATGFVSAVDLAVSDTGDVFVAELFAGAISVLNPAGKIVVALVPLPGAIEWAHGKLYAAIDVLGPDGKIVTIEV